MFEAMELGSAMARYASSLHADGTDLGTSPRPETPSHIDIHLSVKCRAASGSLSAVLQGKLAKTREMLLSLSENLGFWLLAGALREQGVVTNKCRP